MYRSNGNPEGYEPTQVETPTRRPYVTLDDGSMEGPWSKIKKVKIRNNITLMEKSRLQR